MTVGNKHRLLSIVIPTHNRFRYASHAIGNVLSIQSDEMEMIVHDTSDDDELESWICSNVSDPRLTYRHVKPPLSMTENHNAAVSLASGDYICLIGDDDGVNPEIMESARWAKELGLDALTPVISATYSWGDFSTRLLGDRHARKLYIGVISGKYRFERVDNALDRCLKNACQGTDGLPKIYHGIVRRTCLQDVYAKTGAFFFGVSPDVSGAIALAPHVKKFCVIDYPLTIPGASGGSNTGRSALNQHKGSLDDDPHMKPFKNVNWPDLVPRFFSVQTVWAQAALEALAVSGRDDLINRFDFTKLHALCLWFHRERAREISTNYMRILSQRNEGAITGLTRLVWKLGGIILLRGIYYARRLVHPSVSAGKAVVDDVPDIAAAATELSRYLEGKGIWFSPRVGS